MGIFSGLFGKKTVKPPKAHLTPEQFMREPLVIETAQKVRRNALLLHPGRSRQPLGAELSKFGGQPNLSGFMEWPYCENCKSPMNFVLQLYQHDFPFAWFPIGKDLMQVWRCSNSQCQGGGEEYDIPTFLYFFEDKGSDTNSGLRLEVQDQTQKHRKKVEVIHECSLTPESIEDYPDYEENICNTLDAEYGYRLMEVWHEAFPCTDATKLLGWPSWIQYPDYPICECGAYKDFIFQLSGREPSKDDPDASAPYGIEMGDGGSMYFFVCLECGEKSIESRWDCY